MSARVEFALHRFALAWVNSLLCPPWPKALSLHSDFQNGCRLVALAEVVTGAAVPGAATVPASPEDRALNTRLAFARFEDFFAVSLVGAQADTISQGVTALLLDLLLFVATKASPESQFVSHARENGFTFTSFTVVPRQVEASPLLYQQQPTAAATTMLAVPVPVGTSLAGRRMSTERLPQMPQDPDDDLLQQRRHKHHHKHHHKQHSSGDKSGGGSSGDLSAATGGFPIQRGGFPASLPSLGVVPPPPPHAIGMPHSSRLSMTGAGSQHSSQAHTPTDTMSSGTHTPYWLVQRVRGRHGSAGASTSSPPSNSPLSPGSPRSDPATPAMAGRKHRGDSPFLLMQQQQQQLQLQQDSSSPSMSPATSPLPSPTVSRRRTDSSSAARVPHTTAAVNVALMSSAATRPRAASSPRGERAGSISSPRRLRASRDACRKGLTNDTIPDWLREEFAKTAEADLSCNRFDTVPDALFEEPSMAQSKLEHLNLACNAITSLPVLLLPTLRALTVLRLNSNPLGELSACVFTLPRLSRLCATSCRLTSIAFPPADSGAVAPIQELELDENSLSSIPEGIAVLSNTLQYLSAAGNALESLPLCLGGMPRLSSLIVSGNRLESVPTTLTTAKRLTSLDLADNRIAALPAVWFSATAIAESKSLIGGLFGSVTELELERNRISALPDNFFEVFGAIEFLDISDNQLEVLPSSISGAIRLESLYASGNRLREVPQALGQLEALCILDVSRNFLRMLPLFPNESGLQTLIAGFNPLRLAPLTIPGFVSKLHLSGCKLREVPAYKLPKLETLFLADNDLKTVDLSGVVQEKLRFVDLSNNRLREQPAELVALGTGIEIQLSGNGFATPGRGAYASNFRAFEPRLRVGMSEMQGRGSAMEDSVCAMGDLLGDKTTDLVVVVDGFHCGMLAFSTAVRIAKGISEALQRGNEREAIADALQCADDYFSKAQKPGEPQGASVLVGLFTSNAALLHVANLGNTRVVLCHCGEPLQLSEDHTAADDEEYARITGAGGFVTDRGLVMGETRLTRALGHTLLRPYVSDEMTFTQFEIVEGDEFLIFASGCVWDVVKPEVAVGVVREMLLNGMTPSQASLALRDLAYNSEAEDNLTVVVVALGGFGGSRPSTSRTTASPSPASSASASASPSPTTSRRAKALAAAAAAASVAPAATTVLLGSMPPPPTRQAPAPPTTPAPAPPVALQQQPRQLTQEQMQLRQMTIRRSQTRVFHSNRHHI